MKFSGKELFELGIPQNKIKFLINKEFNSKEELLSSLSENVINKDQKIFTWIDYLTSTFTYLPMKLNGDKPEKMTKSELKRIFDSNSIEINNKNFKSTDECVLIEFPIKSIIWYPKGKRKITW